MNEPTIKQSWRKHLGLVFAIGGVALTAFAWFLHAETMKEKLEAAISKVSERETALQAEKARALSSIDKLKSVQELFDAERLSHAETRLTLKRDSALLANERAERAQERERDAQLLAEEKSRLKAVTAAKVAPPPSAGEYSYLHDGFDAAQKSFKKWIYVSENTKAYCDANNVSMFPFHAVALADNRQKYMAFSVTYEKLNAEPIDPAVTPYNGEFSAAAIALAKRRVVEYPSVYDIPTPRFISANVSGAATINGQLKIYLYHVWGEMDVPNGKGAYIRNKYSVILADMTHVDGRTGKTQEASYRISDSWGSCTSIWTDLPVYGR